MDFEPALAFRATVAEESRRPPALEVSTTPHLYFFHPRKFERAIHPAAATPARRAHVPVRMVIEGDKDERFAQPPNPQRG